MTELTTLTQLLILSFWCYGWHHLFSPGEALYFISKGAYKRFEKAKAEKENKQNDINDWYFETQKSTCEDSPLRDLYNEKLEHNTEAFERKIYFIKPTFLCSICFASIYGTGGYVLLNYTTWGVFPVAVISLIPVNKIMQKFL